MYTKTNWSLHWEWMLQFFKHKNYILVNRQPMLLVQGLSKVARYEELAAYWRKAAVEAGIL